MACISVVLPAPLAPINVTISPATTCSVTPCRTSMRPYALLTFSIESTNRLLRAVNTQIGLDHRRIGPHLFGGAFGEGSAVCQNMNTVGDIHHQTHIMLDQHDRDSILYDGADHAIDFLGFDRITAGGRLVEQQQLGVAS